MRLLDIGNPEANPQFKLHSICFTINHWTAHHLEGHFSVCVLYFIIKSVLKKNRESRTGKENKGLSTGQTENFWMLPSKWTPNDRKANKCWGPWPANDKLLRNGWMGFPIVLGSEQPGEPGAAGRDGTCRRPQVQGLTSHCPTHHPAWHLFPSFILTTENGLFISAASIEAEKGEGQVPANIVLSQQT